MAIAKDLSGNAPISFGTDPSLDKDDTSPADEGFSITADDLNDLSRFTRGIAVDTAGDVAMTLTSGDDVTMELLPGYIYPLKVKRVKATSTTATGIKGFA